MTLINKFVRIIFSRWTIGMLFLLVQIAILVLCFQLFNRYVVWLFGGFNVLSILIVLYLINSKTNPSYKIGWIVPLLVFPVLGVVIFLMYRLQIKTKLILKKIYYEHEKAKKYLVQDNKVKNNILNEDKRVYNLCEYLYNNCGYPVYFCDSVKYFKDGESKFDDLLVELKKAKKFIFLEYFIINKGFMWNTILEILKEKVMEGVEVRVMYDGMGTFKTLPYNYPEELRKNGINCKVFFPMKLELSFHQNNRDHRKIAVIDGKVAYTGGINLADEYINKKERFGHWKDTAIKIKGKSVNSLTMMFLEMWNVENNKPEEYKIYLNDEIEDYNYEQGYVVPYGDRPLDEYHTGKTVYMDILNTAQDYVDIITPYLILDDELLSAINYAASRNVKVRIIMPHIPDKKSAYYLGRSYYRDLIKSGVEIYEYKKGFTHAKMFISDNNKAVVGTINLDYRSLYLHFECACYIYKNRVIKDIQKDFDDTISKCIRITMKQVNEYSVIKRIIGRVLRFLAPLM